MEKMETMETTIAGSPLARGPEGDRMETPMETKPRESPPKKDPIKPHCYLARLRALALSEYGMAGWVNPAKIAPKVPLLECQAMRGLDHLGYVAYDRQDGAVGYRQRKVGEAKA